MQRWLFFVAFIALLPTTFAFLVASVTNKDITWQDLFGKGELIVGALALSADAAGGLTGKELKGSKLFVFLLCIFAAIVMAGMVSFTVTGLVPTGTMALANYSVYFFAAAFVISAIGKLVTET
jgi:hypothetical protein